MKTYLDYNATAPMLPDAIKAITDIMQGAHNASAVHSYGRDGRMAVERARESVAALINATPSMIIFNSGATEGNNTVINHFKGERILASAIEHPAVLEASGNIEQIPVTADGLVDLSTLEAMLKTGKTGLVSVMMVNNETGVIQPMAEISALAHKHGALLHCDAVQAAGRIEIDMPTLGIDFLTFSAHKIGGPQGVGALALGLCGITPTLLHGGGQEKSARAGTENVAGIAGFGAAAHHVKENMSAYREKTAALQKTLETALESLPIHGQNAPRVTNTTLFSLPHASSETLLMALDLDGIAVSNGSACSSGRVEPSHVLKAMNLPTEHASGAIRISTGWDSSTQDIENFLKSWDKIASRMNKKAQAHA
jgi:cysteine desulfurase